MEWPVKSFRANNLGSNIYVVFSEAGTIVIDAGSTEDSAFRRVIHYLQEFHESNTHQKMIYLFLTHAHHRHASAVTIFREKLSSIEVIAHAHTANQLNDLGIAAVNPSIEPFLCDQAIQGSEQFDFQNFTLRALPLAGHCEGHLSFLLHNLDETTPSYGKKYLFVGDLLLQYGLAAYSIKDSSVSKLIHSMRRASDLDFLVAFPGHGPALVRRQFVSTAALALIDLMAREDQVLNYLSKPRSTEEVCRYVFDWLLRTGEDFQSCFNMTLHHLRKLQAENCILDEGDLWILSENPGRSANKKSPN